MPNNFEITPNRQSNGLDMKMFLLYILCTKLATKCDLDLHSTNIVPATTHCLVKIIIYPTMQDTVMNWTLTCFTKAYAQSLSVDCDLDVSPSDIVFALDTLSCYHNYFAK